MNLYRLKIKDLILEELSILQNVLVENVIFFIAKNNYALKMKRRIPIFNEFWACWGKKIIEINKLGIIDTNFPNRVHLYLTYDLINEMMECISFPKATYWSVENNIDWKLEKDVGDCRYESISLVKINRK